MTEDHASLAYVKERWHALAVGVAPAARAATWEIFAGAVAVGIRAAMLTSGNEDMFAIARFCGGPMPEVFAQSSELIQANN